MNLPILFMLIAPWVIIAALLVQAHQSGKKKP